MNQSGAMQNLKGLEYSLPKVIVSRTCGGSRKSSFSVDIYIYIYIYVCMYVCMYVFVFKNVLKKLKFFYYFYFKLIFF
jgi:hypothetical protein